MGDDAFSLTIPVGFDFELDVGLFCVSLFGGRT